MINELCRKIDPKSFCSKVETLGAQAKCFDAYQNVEKNVCIVGIPDDRGIANVGGHIGAASGPKAFRESFYKIYDRESLGHKVIDCGDILLKGEISQTHEALAECVKRLLEAKASLVVVVGGGHDFSYGSYAGHFKAMQEKMLPVINFDGHFDLRPSGAGGQISSGTPFRRIIENFPYGVGSGKLLCEVGIQSNANAPSLREYADLQLVKTLRYDACSKSFFEKSEKEKVEVFSEIKKFLDHAKILGWNSHNIHVSLDLDVFSSSIAPGTSASTPFGCDVHEIAAPFLELNSLGNCRVLDVAELCPTRDFNQQTARLAAGLVERFALRVLHKDVVPGI